MKNKEFQELKTKSVAELQATLVELRDKLWDLKSDLKRGKVKNVRDVRNSKKNIARVLTLINKK